jgi:hypothetical protein
MKKVFLLLVILLAFIIPLYSSVTVDTLYLHGSVGPRNFLTVSQTIGAVPETAIPLDSGPVLIDSGVIGASVGSWSVSSNSASNLVLRVEYSPFTTVIEDVSYSIHYKLNNGTAQVDSGSIFKTLVRNNGRYIAEDNSGTIYLKRVDSNTYPPSNDYLTTITFILSTE